MTNTEKTEILAKFMGWIDEGVGIQDSRKFKSKIYYQIGTDGQCYFSEHTGYGETGWEIHIFSPLTNWNHWRDVEMKVMEDDLHWAFVDALPNAKFASKKEMAFIMMTADLPTRVDALLAALQSLSPEKNV